MIYFKILLIILVAAPVLAVSVLLLLRLKALAEKMDRHDRRLEELEQAGRRRELK